jgi:DNA replication protein DnaC
MSLEPRVAMVQAYCHDLRLPTISRECQAVVREAEERGWGYVQYLQSLLEQEVAHRHEQMLRQRLKQAAFPYHKALDEFDFSLIPSLPKTRIWELAQGTFLTTHDNVLLVGGSGLGKTHVLIGLGRALCLSGCKVLFRSASTLVTELEMAHKELRLPRLLASYRDYALILIDELGYLPFSKSSAELLFQFFSDRYERASVAITTNLPFGQWTQVFGEERMTAALIDRLIHRSHILEFKGESFRFRQSLQRQDGDPS